MMKIAVPSRDGAVDAHFGHCEYYTVFTVKDGVINTEERMDSPTACGCKSGIAPILADAGVSVMLAGNMGEGAVRVLDAHGIEAVRGASGPVRNVVESYLAGKLVLADGSCAGHGHDCTH
jgi:predicted Fe-Mo cluster-binding NifX family protein